MGGREGLTHAVKSSSRSIGKSIEVYVLVV